ncbi:hypothetical protein [Salmonella phage SSE121]|uniref:Uncharacterized protein n=1 Tax=Salmonella phage SSE121 TaxID=1204529 RepID=K4IEV6_9CAUD|nr:hypothetical protein ACQ19_gp143 [Salmonella phage SSE121]AFU63784.1 hypothetical protein [Salmonella phage SSE121]
MSDVLDGQSQPPKVVKDLYKISEWSDVETLASFWHDDCMMITCVTNDCLMKL